ncbi:MAG: hypothetical protein ACAI44_16770 [Candidatus Sericytochromatia bacterium]
MKQQAIDLTEIQKQLQAGDTAVRLQAVALLRKRALKREDFSALAPDLLQALQAGEPELKSLLLKLADNILKGRYGVSLEQDETMFRLQVRLYLQALVDPLAAIRKAGIYGLHTLLYHFNHTGGTSWLYAPELLATVASLIADTGCDLDVAHYMHPLMPKGTLTIAQQARRVVFEFPRKADYAPVFYEVVPALERMHVYISNGLLEDAYGQKLVENVIDVFAGLIGREVPLPASRRPDIYPEWLVELISFTNDHKYHSISDLSIYRLLRPLVFSPRHTGALVNALESDDYWDVKAVLLRLLGDKLEHGESLKWCLPRLKAVLADDRYADLPIPEAMLKKLEQAP